MLLVVPFLINLGAGLAGLYPYGGTRHDILLVGFAMTGISISLARLKIASTWLKPLALAVALTICNLFPFPTPPYISPRDQKKELMTEAMNYLGQGTPMSAIVTDYQGGLLLSYYLCSKSAVDLAAMSQEFVRSQCRDYQVLTPPQAFFIFNPETFPGVMRNFQQRYNLSQDTPVWLFQAGWIDSSDNLCHELGRNSGWNFGKNILLCEINGAAEPTID